MSRIDLYFIPQQGPQARLHFACRLLEKAYQQGAAAVVPREDAEPRTPIIYVQMESAEKARFFDQLLWTYRDDSFIPHHVQQDRPELNSPIVIGYGPKADTQAEILLNLNNEIPAFHAQFKRILEILPNDPVMLTRGQEHRVFYEEKGYTIHSHQLTK